MIRTRSRLAGPLLTIPILAHEGRIDVESGEMRTTFRVSLPRIMLEIVKL